MSALRSYRQPLAYSFAEAGEATGYSEETIKRAVAAGDLTPRYANRKPVIPATELLAWLESLPVDRDGVTS